MVSVVDTAKRALVTLVKSIAAIYGVGERERERERERDSERAREREREREKEREREREKEKDEKRKRTVPEQHPLVSILVFYVLLLQISARILTLHSKDAFCTSGSKCLRFCFASNSIQFIFISMVSVVDTAKRALVTLVKSIAAIYGVGERERERERDSERARERESERERERERKR